MIKSKMYRYLGRNGIITSPILLEKVEPITMHELLAGEQFAKAKLVFADELEDWIEIDDPDLE